MTNIFKTRIPIFIWYLAITLVVLNCVFDLAFLKSQARFQRFLNVNHSIEQLENVREPVYTQKAIKVRVWDKDLQYPGDDGFFTKFSFFGGLSCYVVTDRNRTILDFKWYAT